MQKGKGLVVELKFFFSVFSKSIVFLKLCDGVSY